MIFAFPSDLRVSDTITATGAGVEALYPLSNLHDGRPTEVCRFDDDIETRIVWDAGSAVTLEGLLIVMHTFAAGATLKVQAHASDSWGAPTFSQDVVVPAWPDHLPANISVDLRGTALATTGFRYRSLLIPAQTADHALGEVLWVSTWRQTAKSPSWPMRRQDVRRITTNRTAYGVDHVVERGVRQRRILPAFDVVGDADRALLLQLVRLTDGAKHGWPVLRLGRSEEPLYVRFHPDTATHFEEQLMLPSIHRVQLDLLEVQRGRPL